MSPATLPMPARHNRLLTVSRADGAWSDGAVGDLPDLLHAGPSRLGRLGSPAHGIQLTEQRVQCEGELLTVESGGLDHRGLQSSARS